MEVHIIHFESIDSTNNWAKEHAKSFDPDKMTCIIAQIQTAGRGCYAKQWVSKKGNLTMSLFFHHSLRDPLLPHLAQLLSYTTYQVLKKEKVEAQIKWPNDLLYQGKKLCGILAETVHLDDVVGVIIGIGLNVNAAIETDQPTTSLFEITGRTWDLTELANKIIGQFQIDLKLDVERFQELYSKLISGATESSG